MRFFHTRPSSLLILDLSLLTVSPLLTSVLTGLHGMLCAYITRKTFGLARSKPSAQIPRSCSATAQPACGSRAHWADGCGGRGGNERAHDGARAALAGRYLTLVVRDGHAYGCKQVPAPPSVPMHPARPVRPRANRRPRIVRSPVSLWAGKSRPLS